jgi:hypothetical protein
MAIYQGEVVAIEATFDSPPTEPVRAWVQPPRQSVAGAAITMQRVTDTSYTAQYLAADHGMYRVRIESEDPIAADEAVFTAQPQKVTKPTA